MSVNVTTRWAPAPVAIAPNCGYRSELSAFINSHKKKLITSIRRTMNQRWTKRSHVINRRARCLHCNCFFSISLSAWWTSTVISKPTISHRRWIKPNYCCHKATVGGCTCLSKSHRDVNRLQTCNNQEYRFLKPEINIYCTLRVKLPSESFGLPLLVLCRTAFTWDFPGQ